MGAGWAGKQRPGRGWFLRSGRQPPRVPVQGRATSPQTWRKPGSGGGWVGWVYADTSVTPDGGEAAWRSSQPVPRRALPFHTRVLQDPPAPLDPLAAAAAAPRAGRGAPPPAGPGFGWAAALRSAPLGSARFGSARPQRSVRLGSARLGSARGRGRGAPPFWIRTVGEPPPARRGAGSGLAEPRARARAARASERAGERAGEGGRLAEEEGSGWEPGCGSLRSPPRRQRPLLLPRLRRRLRPSAKMPSAQGWEEGTGVAARTAAVAAVARVL